MTNLTQNFFIL